MDDITAQYNAKVSTILKELKELEALMDSPEYQKAVASDNHDGTMYGDYTTFVNDLKQAS